MLIKYYFSDCLFFLLNSLFHDFHILLRQDKIIASRDTFKTRYCDILYKVSLLFAAI